MPAATRPNTTAARRRVHALQIEINRALYLDEARLVPAVGFARLTADLDRLFGALSARDWSSLSRDQKKAAPGGAA